MEYNPLHVHWHSTRHRLQRLGIALRCFWCPRCQARNALRLAWMMPPDRQLGHAWVLLCCGLVLHVTDEALTGFLSVYNPTVAAIRERVPWIPIPQFAFEAWLTDLLVGTAVLLALSPFVYRGAAWMRPVAYIFSGIMIANGLGHTAGTIAGQTFNWIRFSRPMPGFYSSPFILAAAVNLLFRLKHPMDSSSRSTAGIAF
jgi:hypothetical protein